MESRRSSARKINATRLITRTNLSDVKKILATPSEFRVIAPGRHQQADISGGASTASAGGEVTSPPAICELDARVSDLTPSPVTRPSPRGSALLLGRATPDAMELSCPQRERQAFALDRADHADRFGLYSLLPPWAGRRNREEQVRVSTPASRSRSPPPAAGEPRRPGLPGPLRAFGDSAHQFTSAASAGVQCITTPFGTQATCRSSDNGFTSPPRWRTWIPAVICENP